MNTISQAEEGAGGSFSSVSLASGHNHHRSLPSVHVAGFASLANLKDEGCTMAGRGGRRIQINHLGVGVGGPALSKSQPLLRPPMDVGPASKKRWSFHSANQISELLKKDKALKPLSPNKRRKSHGAAVVNSTNVTPSTSEDGARGGIKAALEQSRSSRHPQQHVLTSHQQQVHRHHQRRISTGRIISLKEEQDQEDALSSKRRRSLKTGYYPSMDPYELPFHPFRVRKSKHFRETPPPPDHFSSMPDEIVLRVLKYLPKPALAAIGQTSQRFLKIVHDETLWKRLCCMGKVLLPEHLPVILSRKPIYLRMARAWIPDPDAIPDDVEEIAQSSQLLYLDLSAAHVSASTVALILKCSPKLIKLSLEHLVISKEVMEAMMGFSATIEVLNLTMCYGVDSKLLVQFLTKCKKLRELNLGCMYCDWGGDDLTSIISAIPDTVQQLNVSGYRNVLDNKHVSLIVRRCPNLIELDISDSQEVQGKSLESMLQLRNLQHLGLSQCYGIEPPLYGVLAEHKSLKFLDLFSLFKEASIQHLSSTLPGIEFNKFPFSAIARPTVGNKRSSIWLQRVRD